ncbi:unnamed protein product [Ectocarpus sp. CCAP 1310/34]|nr:unnamed protein product [Ectocarpus sp. CCAP 1310/34]
MDTSSKMPVNSGGSNRDGRQRLHLRPTLFGMRRSCLEYGRRRKGCDGQQPCG